MPTSATFVPTFETIIFTTLLCAARLGNDAPAWGMSIVAAPKTISPEEAFNRTQGFGQIKKYARRSHRWTALGWREGSTKSVDYAVWLDYPFERDAATDTLVQQIFGRAD